MLKKISYLAIFLILIISLSGCATTHKEKDLEMQALRNQILVLENQLQQKDQEIEALKETAETGSQISAATQKSKVSGEVKARPSVKQIQIALKNAGYNPGSIDGKTGKQTRDAIKQFQRSNNLSADGKAGKRTWSLLKEYLYQKVK